MNIKNIELDSLDRQEYLLYIKILLIFYSIRFDEVLELKEGENL